MKCSNCSEDAAYTESSVNFSPAHYCVKHLPQHLRLGAEEGLYPLEELKSDKKKSVKEETE